MTRRAVTTEPSIDELRWLARIKELEWRADLARLVLAGDTAALSQRLAQGPRPVAVPATSTDDALAGYLDELERLCAAATPGPWFMQDGDVWCCPSGEEQQEYIVGLVRVLDFVDGAFVAAARDALPKLIAKVRELQAELDIADKRLRWVPA